MRSPENDPYPLYKEISALLWARDHARSVAKVTEINERIVELQAMIQKQQAAEAA